VLAGTPSGTELTGVLSCTETVAGSPLESDWLTAAKVCAGGGGAVKRPSVVESSDAASASEFESFGDFVEEFVVFWLEDVSASVEVAEGVALVLPDDVEEALPAPRFFPVNVPDDEDVWDATATDWSPEPDAPATLAPVVEEDFPEVELDELVLPLDGGSGPSVVPASPGSPVVDWPAWELWPEVDPLEVDFGVVVVPLDFCVLVVPDVFVAVVPDVLVPVVPEVVPECCPAVPVVGVVVFLVDPEPLPDVLLTGATETGFVCVPCDAGGVDEAPFVPGVVGCTPKDCVEEPPAVSTGVPGSAGSVPWSWPGTRIRIGGTGVGTSALASPSDRSCRLSRYSRRGRNCCVFK